MNQKILVSSQQRQRKNQVVHVVDDLTSQVLHTEGQGVRVDSVGLEDVGRSYAAMTSNVTSSKRALVVCASGAIPTIRPSRSSRVISRMKLPCWMHT